MTSLVWTAAPSPSRGWQSINSLNYSRAEQSFLPCFSFAVLLLYICWSDSGWFISPLGSHRKITNIAFYALLCCKEPQWEIYLSAFWKMKRDHVHCSSADISGPRYVQCYLLIYENTHLELLFCVSHCSFLTHRSLCSSKVDTSS